MGVTVAVDDFGTGYSSLSYLRRFPVHVVKIDRSFIADLGTAAADDAIVHAVIAMGHTLGLRVVAEGIETAAQAAILSDLSCDVGQGWLYGRPEPATTALLPEPRPELAAAAANQAH